MPYTNLLKGDTNSHATCLSQKRKAGRKKFKETRHPVFHGVRERDRGKWVCEVREPHKKSRIWLGTYPNAELAAMAHDVAALALKGERAALNFPDFAWGLAPQAKSTSAQDIRLAILQVTRCELLSSKILSSSENNNSKSNEGNKKFCANNDNMKCLEKGDIVEDNSKELFLDEEAIFNMPSLINGMAEGMLLTPPSLKRGVNWDQFHDYENSSYIELDLW